MKSRHHLLTSIHSQMVLTNINPREGQIIGDMTNTKEDRVRMTLGQTDARS